MRYEIFNEDEKNPYKANENRRINNMTMKVLTDQIFIEKLPRKAKKKYRNRDNLKRVIEFRDHLVKVAKTVNEPKYYVTTWQNPAFFLYKTGTAENKTGVR